MFGDVRRDVIRSGPVRFDEYFVFEVKSEVGSVVKARDRVDGERGAIGEVVSMKRCGLDGDRDRECRICLIDANLSTGETCAWVGESRCGALLAECRGEYSNSITARSSEALFPAR